jgi:hypothetical protein
MCSFGWKAILAGALVLVAVIGPDRGRAQSKIASQEGARHVLDTNWLQALESKPVPLESRGLALLSVAPRPAPWRPRNVGGLV